MGSFGPKKEIQLRSVGANSRFSPGDRYYMMLRWGTAAAACLLLGGVRGAVMASNGEEAKSGDAERRSLKMTKDGSVEKMLFDFTDPALFGEEQAASWWESSDTVRSAGMSKAVFSLQQSVRFQRAVLFAMINPQPNGAGFAGVKSNVNFSEELLQAKPQGFLLKLRGQGQLQYWKVVLTDSDQLGLPLLYTYEHKFHLHSLNNRQMEEVHLPLTEFAAFYRGQQVEDAPPIDLTKIGAFGLQTFGGVYDEFKQSGVGSLEIDSISLY